MTEHTKAALVLKFDPIALERCFLPAAILDQWHGTESVEYGAVGLVDRDDPLRVVATVLLPGQQVTAASVYASGFNIMRLRREVAALSRHLNLSLAPVCWVHSHPGGTQPSGIDLKFTRETFINHAAAALTSTESRRTKDAFHNGEHAESCTGADPRGDVVMVEYALCFAMVVNAQREHSIFAVRKEWCPFCSEPEVRFESAKVQVEPDRPLTALEYAQLRGEVEREIEAKITIGWLALTNEGVV